LSFTFATFETTTTSAAVVNYQAAPNLINDFQIYDNLGSELINQTGDIALKTLAALPFNNLTGVKNWLEVKFNNNPVNVYYIGSSDDSDNTFNELDQKRNLYNVRLPTIQAVFHRDLGLHRFAFSSNADDWNGNLNANSEVIIEQIRDDQGGQRINRVAFTPGDALRGLSGKTSGKGYKIATSINSLPGKDVLPGLEACILFAGEGANIGDTDEVKINTQFQNPPILWRDIIAIALASTNAFIYAKGSIFANELIIDINLIRRTTGFGSAKIMTWIERSLLKNRFSFPGVRIRGAHDDLIDDSPYILGDADTQGALNINIELTGNVVPTGVDTSFRKRYIAGGIEDIITSEFDIQTDLVDNNNLWYKSLNTDSFYTPFIATGDIYRGQILYNGEIVGDQVVVDSDSLQLIRQTIRPNGVSNVEFNVVE